MTSQTAMDLVPQLEVVPFKAQTYVQCASRTHSFTPISPPNGVKEITALFHPLLIVRPWMEAV